MISNTPRLFCARSLTSSDDGIEPSCSRVFNAHIPFSGVDHHSIMADVASTERQRESADQEGREKGKRMDEHRLASVVIRCFAFLYLGVIAYLIVIENTHSICPSSCMCWERETPRGQMMQQKKKQPPRLRVLDSIGVTICAQAADANILAERGTYSAPTTSICAAGAAQSGK